MAQRQVLVDARSADSRTDLSSSENAKRIALAHVFACSRPPQGVEFAHLCRKLTLRQPPRESDLASELAKASRVNLK
jgi:hypothetical protein